MNFIKRIITKFNRDKVKNNNLCDNYISKINQELLAFHQLTIDADSVVDMTDVIDWKCKNEELISSLMSREIKKLKRTVNYKNLLVKRESLLDCFYEAKQKVTLYNSFIMKKKIEEAYSIIGKVEGKELDRQQMECIVTESYNHLVIAGAGTGKTTTIVGKVKYLIKLRQCLPEEILVLSFTNASASEMKDRITNEIGVNIATSTFHKLGLNIITAVDGKKPNITKIDLRKYVKEQLKLNMQSKEYLNLLETYLLYNRVIYKSEFEFKTQDEYEEYLCNNPPTTMKNEIVKSYGEMDIANFLYQNNIEYIYESPYKYDTRTEKHMQYIPDFYLPHEDIYIEYFGINREGEVPPYFKSKHGKSPSKEYQETIDWKRKIHSENKTSMIECYAYEKLEGNLLESLEKKLINRSVKMERKRADELWNDFKNDTYLEIIIELFETLINLIKSNNYTIETLKELSSISSHSKDNHILLALLEPIYVSYIVHLKTHDELDFNDMINIAMDYVKKGMYSNPYKYVIIDEYQDISKARFNLLYNMRRSNDFNLFCVGDDWQSIYRFAGSDINFILNFENYWGNSVISKIENTYRFGQKLIEVSGNFIMQNPMQIKKNIQGHSNFNGSVIGEINAYNEKSAINFMLNKLDDLPKNSTVFFIGRYSFDYKILENNNFIKCKYHNENNILNVEYVKRKDLKMDFITAHKSKGLQADYIFIINNKKSKMGFPSKIQDAPILELLLDNCDNYLFAEERRLFYVALTRAKIKVFFLTIQDQESSFINELRKAYAHELKWEKFECPLCGGRLLLKKSRFGEFFGCENYKKSNCTYKRNKIKR